MRGFRCDITSIRLKRELAGDDTVAEFPTLSVNRSES